MRLALAIAHEADGAADRRAASIGCPAGQVGPLLPGRDGADDWPAAGVSLVDGAPIQIVPPRGASDPDVRYSKLRRSWTGLLRRNEELLREQRRERRRALSLAHDLIGPLRAIAGNADAIARDVGEGEAGARRVREIALRALDRVQDVLRAERLERGDPVQAEPLDLAEEAAAASGRRAQTARITGVTLEVAAPDRLVVEAEGELARRAVDLLVDRAVRLCPRGGRVTVQAACAGEAAVVRVCCRPAEDVAPTRPHLLAQAAAPAAPDGSLDLCRLIAEAHGGRLDVDDDGAGTLSHTLRLPRRGARAIREDADVARDDTGATCDDAGAARDAAAPRATAS